MTGFFGTRAEFYSDLGLVLEVVTTLLFTVGYFYEKRTGRHCVLMGGAVIVNILFVLSYMVGRFLRAEVPSPAPSFATVYGVVVILHSVLSVVVLVLTAGQAFFAYRWRTKKESLVVLGRRRLTHRRLGLATLGLWYISFLSGIIVYAILYIL